MPIYEYQATDREHGCSYCRKKFETFQSISEEALTACPVCGRAVRKLISWCRAAIVDQDENDARVSAEVKEYESRGMWSHAAETADTHAEKTGDESLKSRAVDNYQKAGYDVDRLLDKTQ